MPAKAKKINLYLENGTLEGPISISESDGWDFGGELYACPRDNFKELFNDETLKKNGVYLLLSSERVYVGQSTNLKSRIEQHINKKEWWERVVLLTSASNKLTQEYITYLESALIQKAHECGTLDCDNKTDGNRNTLNKYDAKLLDQYLEEAYFIMELIGIKIFLKNNEKKSKKAIIETIPIRSSDEVENRSKKEIFNYLLSKGIEIEKNSTYARLQSNKNIFWANPQIKLLNLDWTFVLNDQDDNKIIILKIPANTFFVTDKKVNNGLFIRKDMPHRLDLNIDKNSLIEKRSGVNFSPFIKKTIIY